MKKIIPPLIFLVCILTARPMLLLGLLPLNAIQFFAPGLLTCTAAAMLLMERENLLYKLKSMPRDLQICTGILFASGLIHFLVSGFYEPEYAGWNLCWILIPLFAAVYAEGIQKWMPLFLILLFILNAILVPYHRLTGRGAFGLTGNWNWSAFLVLAALPFLVFLIQKTIRQKTVRAGLLILSGTVAIWLLLQANSRSAWVMLAVMLFTGALLRFRQKRKILLITAGTLFFAGLAAALFLFPDKTALFLAQEIRPALWESALPFLRENPLGAGAAGFENAWIPFRSAAYFMNSMAAVRTTHPHNELLYIACTLGIPAALAWIWWNLSAILRFFREYDRETVPLKKALFFLVYTGLLTTGMLDLTFHVWPLEQIVLLSFGTFAFPSGDGNEDTPGTARKLAYILALLCLVAAGRNLAGTILLHRAETLEQVRFAAGLAPAQVELIYSTAGIAEKNRRYDDAMKITDWIQEYTPNPDFAHIHAMRARFFAITGHDEQAVPEYKAEALCYPLQILPLIGEINSLGRLGRTPEIPAVQQRLDNIIRIRGLSENDIRNIMTNPKLDSENPVPNQLKGP